ncbi:MAG: hypothetical protein HY701_13665, partial [Gemmatimonadetes bacterium]|nr:hypothetical protein [Gemmatimonadota bacterium]
MIELRTLGTLELRVRDGPELGDVLSRRHRVALLVYLALQHQRSFVARDTLLGIFWPELDQFHARRALRQALHVLRDGLGHEVLAARGNEEVGIAGDAFWCDAEAFSQALDAGDARQALALYRGDLLEGFFLSQAPEFEQWLEKERSRLRGLAASAAARLGQAAAAHGDLPDAAHWLHRALDLVPDEVLLRGLIRVLDQLGDRAAALQVYGEFARRMSSEFDIEPSAETQKLIAELRARSGEPAGAAASRGASPRRRDGPDHSAPRDAAAVAAAPVGLRVPEDDSPGSPARHRRMRRAGAAGMAVFLTGLGVAGGALGLRWLGERASAAFPTDSPAALDAYREGERH